MADVLLPLALLYADRSRQIEGATRFQKLAFLTQKEGDIGERHEFKADKYGPFSPTLAGALKTLETKGYLQRDIRTTQKGNEEYIYSLTNKGRRAIQNLRQDEERDIDSILDAAQQIKQSNNNVPLDRLLRYVYKKFPEYTSESELDLADEI
ncbi:helix-turn-helix transcriptional regulator [Halorientalis brevis]|uniref:Helix-turn-helix transcriptional regulator n=1 Tax=Halorientalis brevis TaxID=1126241 RepID=A0ABD6CFU5_9EURY|nr:helix-turn-helix transcriptional regulator [Halorientalis brevis]